MGWRAPRILVAAGLLGWLVLIPALAAGASPASAPTSVAATAGPGQVTLRWAAPASDGGSPINDYQVSVSRGPWVSLGVVASPATVAGLTNGLSYDFQLRAVTAVGPGAASAVVSATPAGTPGPITAPVVSALSASETTITWLPPYDDGGSVVIGYEWSLDGSAWAPTGTTSAVVSGLAPLSDHLLRVRALNASGPGAIAPGIEFTTLAAGSGTLGGATGGAGSVAPSPSASSSGSPAPVPGRPAVPGDYSGSSGTVTWSVGKPGVGIITLADGRLLYLDERASTNAIAASVPPIWEALLSLRNAVVAGVVTLIFVVVGLTLGAPVELVKDWIKKAWKSLVALFPRAPGAGAPLTRWQAWAGALAFMAVGQFIATFNAPLDQIAPLRQTLQNVAFGIVAVLLMSYVRDRPEARFHRELHGDRGQVTAEWPVLLLTAAGVIFAQVTGMVPGLVIGVFAARRFRASLSESHSGEGAWRAGWTLIVGSLLAWVALDVVGLLVPDETSVLRAFCDTVLAMIVVGGTQGLLWALAGPGEEAGKLLRAWSVGRWVGLVFCASFALVGIVAAGGSRAAALLRPNLDVHEELLLLASGLAFLAILTVAQRVRHARMPRPEVEPDPVSSGAGRP